MPVAHPLRILALPPVLAIVLLAGCDPVEPDPGPGTDPLAPTDSTLAASCMEDGPTHSGEVSGTWGAFDGPHHLTGSVDVENTLTIEAGALICGSEGARIRLSRGSTLRAHGERDAPIVFTAADSLLPWGGITGGYPLTEGAVDLAHVRIEHAGIGVEATQVAMSDAVIRRTQSAAVAVRDDIGGMSNTLARVVIDHPCLSDGAAAVHQGDRSDLALIDVIIRDSGCNGIFSQEYSLSLRNVRIEGSAGIGLQQYWSGRAGGPQLASVEGLRITGGADRPLSVNGATARMILAAVPMDSLTGNAIDRITVFHAIPGDIRITPELGWELGLRVGDHQWAHALPERDIFMEPGSRLRMTAANLDRGDDTRLIAEGTADRPIRIDALEGERANLRLEGEAGDTSRLDHVSLERVRVEVRDNHTLLASNIAVKDAVVSLEAPGSVIRNATLDDASAFNVPHSFAALVLAGARSRVENVVVRGSAGNGMLVTGSGSRVEGCTITGSELAGIWVANEATGVAIRGCSFTGNGGVGVRNTVDAVVDASMNWWGDPEGPTGPDGAGVSGNVDFDPWLTEPPSDGSD